ncbi:MAG: phosphotransferase [Armatimonadota bacterium]|nr:phosphotransferase [Armatimonadota bacterium]
MESNKQTALLQSVCAVYNLGRSTDPPIQVKGGLQHTLYHIATPQGEYAVKVLNPGMKDARENCRPGELIARLARGAGLPAVCALEGPDGHYVQDADRAAVMVFPWHAGHTLPPTSAPLSQAAQIGEILGRLHALELTVPGLTPPAPQWFPEAHWEELIRAGTQEETPWAETLADGVSELRAWNQETRRAEAAMGESWVTTHRDLDQKNVLWSGATAPWLLDWEAAGRMPPTLEVMGAALNWAGQSAGAPEQATFAAFVAGYRGAAPLAPDALKHAAVAVLGKWLVWLELNLRRSLASSQAPPEERALAYEAASHAFATLRRMAADTPTRLAWCDTLG